MSLFRPNNDEDEIIHNADRHLLKTVTTPASLPIHSPVRPRDVIIEEDRHRVYMDSFHPKDTQKNISFEDTLFSDNPVRATATLAHDKLEHAKRQALLNREFISTIDGTVHKKKEGFLDNVLLGRKFQNYEKAYQRYHKYPNQPFLMAAPVIFNPPSHKGYNAADVAHNISYTAHELKDGLDHTAHDLKDRAIQWANENKTVQWAKEDHTAHELKDNALQWAKTANDKIQHTIAHPQDLQRDVASRVNYAIDTVSQYSPAPISNLPHIRPDDVNIVNVMKVAAVPLAIGAAAAIASRPSSQPHLDLNDLKGMDMDDIQEHITKLMKENGITPKSAKKALKKAAGNAQDMIEKKLHVDLSELKDMDMDDIQEQIARLMKENGITPKSAKSALSKAAGNAQDLVEKKLHIDLSELKDMDMDDIQKHITKLMKENGITPKSAKSALSKAAGNVQDMVEKKLHVDLSELKDMDMDDIQEHITKLMKENGITPKSVKKALNKAVEGLTPSSDHSELKEQLSALAKTTTGQNNELVNDSLKALLTSVLGINIAKIAGGDEIIKNISQKVLNWTDNDDDDDNKDKEDRKESSSLLPSTKTMLITSTLLSLGAVAHYCNEHNIDLKEVTKEMFNEILAQSTDLLHNVPDNSPMAQKLKKIVSEKTSSLQHGGTVGDALTNVKEGTKLLINKWNVSSEYQRATDELEKTYRLLKKQCANNILPEETTKSFDKVRQEYNEWKTGVNHLIGIERPAVDDEGDVLLPNKDQIKHCIDDLASVLTNVNKGGNAKNTSPTAAITTTIASAVANSINMEDLKALGTTLALDLVNPDSKKGETPREKIQNHIVGYIKTVSSNIHDDLLANNKDPNIALKSQELQKLVEDSKHLYHDVQELATTLVTNSPEIYKNTKKLIQNTSNSERQANIKKQVLASISGFPSDYQSTSALQTDESDYERHSFSAIETDECEEICYYHFNYSPHSDQYSCTDTCSDDDSASSDNAWTDGDDSD